MKYKTLVVMSAFILALAGSAVGQLAETPQPAPVLAYSGPEMSVSGVVVTSATTELVIDSDAGQRLTFALDAQTNPTRTFNNGERVNVRYHALTSGTGFHAAGIALEPLDNVETPRYDVTTSTDSSLPDTASLLPLIGLLGLFAVGGAVVLRVARS